MRTLNRQGPIVKPRPLLLFNRRRYNEEEPISLDFLPLSSTAGGEAGAAAVGSHPRYLSACRRPLILLLPPPPTQSTKFFSSFGTRAAILR